LVLEHAALVAEPGQQVDDEERQPADDEHAHDDAQRLGRLLLAGQLAQLPAQREVFLQLVGSRVASATAAVRGRRRRGRAAAPVYSQRELHPTAAGSSASATGTATAAAAASATGTAARRRGGRQHFGAQPLAPGLRDGRRVNLVVREHHDEQRHVKRYGGREYQVTGAVGERARVAGNGLGADQPPPYSGREADDAAAHPHGGDQPVRPFPAHFRRVRERVGDGPVPVQRYHAKVQYGRRAEQHVQRPPDVARVYAERPVVVEHLLHGAHRHHHQPDQEVGERQRRDEVVGSRVQVPLPDHGDDDQTVTEHGHHAEHHQHRRQREPVAESRSASDRLLRARRVLVVVGRAVYQRDHCRPVHSCLYSSSLGVALEIVSCSSIYRYSLFQQREIVTETHNAIFRLLKLFTDYSV